MRFSVRRHRARSLKGYFILGAAATAAFLVYTGFTQPSPLWRPAPQSLRPAAAEPALSGPPAWIRISKIAVEAPLVALHLDGQGELEAPKDYDIPGWYADGTPPGDMGPAVIAGHVDSLAASAVFRRLEELRAGDLIEIQRSGVWVRFEVTTTARFAKGSFPTAQVYGPTPDAQLRVITCGGSFDRARNSYRDNVVVFAIMKGDG